MYELQELLVNKPPTYFLQLCLN